MFCTHWGVCWPLEIRRFFVFIAAILSTWVSREVLARDCRSWVEDLPLVLTQTTNLESHWFDLGKNDAELVPLGSDEYLLLLHQGVYRMKRLDPDRFLIKRENRSTIEHRTALLSNIRGSVPALVRRMSPNEFENFLWHLDFKPHLDEMITERIQDGPEVLFRAQDGIRWRHVMTLQGLMSRAAAAAVVGFLALSPIPFGFSVPYGNHFLGPIPKLVSHLYANSLTELHGDSLFPLLPFIHEAESQPSRLVRTTTSGELERKDGVQWKYLNHPSSVGLEIQKYEPPLLEISPDQRRLDELRERLSKADLVEGLLSALQESGSVVSTGNAVWLNENHPARELKLSPRLSRIILGKDNSPSMNLTPQGLKLILELPEVQSHPRYSEIRARFLELEAEWHLLRFVNWKKVPYSI